MVAKNKKMLATNEKQKKKKREVNPVFHSWLQDKKECYTQLRSKVYMGKYAYSNNWQYNMLKTHQITSWEQLGFFIGYYFIRNNPDFVISMIQPLFAVFSGPHTPQSYAEQLEENADLRMAFKNHANKEFVNQFVRDQMAPSITKLIKEEGHNPFCFFDSEYKELSSGTLTVNQLSNKC